MQEVYPHKLLGRQYTVSPVSDINQLHLYWPLPGQVDAYLESPTGYISGALALIPATLVSCLCSTFPCVLVCSTAWGRV